MPNGTVKFFNAAKGFGFITSDEQGAEVFVAAASVAAIGVSSLKPGQRVFFETVPDKKGPKAIDLKLIGDAPPARRKEQAGAVPEKSTAKPALTIYLAHGDDAASEILDEVRRAGHEPRIVDYIAAPPTMEELKSLSLLLRNNNQSLARKYEPLFLELQLDDRFISDSEFWTAIHEHPSLINGPVLATAARAGICRSKTDVKIFLAGDSPVSSPVAVKPKGLTQRLLHLVNGGTLQDIEAMAPRKAAGSANVTGQGKMSASSTKPQPGPAQKSKTVAKPKPKAAAPSSRKAKPPIAAKTKASAKPVARKSPKKPVPARKK